MSRFATTAQAKTPDLGLLVVMIGAALSIIDTIFNYFWPRNGIHGTLGALGVIGGAVVIFLGALLLRFSGAWPVWLRALVSLGLLVLILVEGFCAWLLETPILEALVAIMLVGWVLTLTGRRRDVAPLRAERGVAR